MRRTASDKVAAEPQVLLYRPIQQEQDFAIALGIPESRAPSDEALGRSDAPIASLMIDLAMADALSNN